MQNCLLSRPALFLCGFAARMCNGIHIPLSPSLLPRVQQQEIVFKEFLLSLPRGEKLGLFPASSSSSSRGRGLSAALSLYPRDQNCSARPWVYCGLIGGSGDINPPRFPPDRAKSAAAEAKPTLPRTQHVHKKPDFPPSLSVHRVRAELNLGERDRA